MRNYKEYLRKSFIQYAMVLFSAMALLVLVFFLLNYYVTVLKQNETANREVTEVFDAEVRRFLEEAESLSEKEACTELLQEGTSDAKATISRELYAFSNDGAIRARFLVMRRSGEILLSNYTKGNQQIFAESLFVKRIFSRAADMKGETLTLLCDIDFTNDQRSAYSFARPVADETGETAGFLFLNMRTDDLESMADRMNSEVMLLDRYHNAIFASLGLPDDPGDKLPTRRFTQEIDRNGIYEINGVTMYVRRTHLAAWDVDVFTLTSIEHQLDMYRMAAIFFLLTLIALLILMMLMTRLYTELNERGVGDLMRDLEIKNLEEQFNPHFVFNVMESVYFQIDEDPKKAQEMLMAFSTLMRYTINHGHSKVRLETDIDYLNDFLMLQKIRYNNLLAYRFLIPDELLDCMVPKLLIQPIIENSIRHGFVHGQALHIEIAAEHTGGELVFRIRDDGKGIPPERLREIEERFRAEVSDETVKHIGLYHVEKMLSMLYGTRYGLTIDSAPGKGTEVRLNMPYETEEEDV